VQRHAAIDGSRALTHSPITHLQTRARGCVRACVHACVCAGACQCVFVRSEQTE
jgi:hypothetical protein